jgi:simple sugar transport system ATP-binding protein
MVPQHVLLADAMSVVENVVLGDEPGRAWALDLPRAARRLAALAEEVGLPLDPAARAGDLGVGLRQRVELLKALYRLAPAAGEPARAARVLILDEPTAVMTPQEVEGFFAFLRRFRADGGSAVLVTHKLAEVLALSDEVTVMRDGRTVRSLPTCDADAAALARLMVGRDLVLRVAGAAARRARLPPSGPPLLEVRELSVAAGGRGRPAGVRRVEGASFTVHAGEIVGIAGVEGNGQSALVEALAGLADPACLAGSVRLAGEEILRLPARARRDRGVAHVPEDRLRRGLILDFTLAENAVLGVQHRRPISRGPWRALLDAAAIGARARAVLAAAGVRPAAPELPARALSGGNQQKLVVGRELALEPRLLLAAQPTRGVDVGAVETIHRELIARRDRGAAILLVSSELEEVMALADRLLVMAAGRIVAEVDPGRASAAEIGLLMTAGRAA